MIWSEHETHMTEKMKRAAMTAAYKATMDRYVPQIRKAVRDIRELLDGRPESALTGNEAVACLAAKMRLGALLAERDRFIEAELTRRLNPERDGSELVDA
jgi:hypothetical protein